ncbi:hypothetical protein GF377_11030 [candidate division GN15 bacterium]|nr:hypothetical protein [candidate division GN15 bacterium]
MGRQVFLILVVMTSLLAVWVGCGQRPVLTHETAAQDSRTVATFDPDYRLTGADYYDYLFRSTLQQDGGLVPDSAAREFLTNLIIDTIFTLEAGNIDLRRYWPYYHAARGAFYRQMLDSFWLHEVVNEVEIDSAYVMETWRNEPDLFRIPEMVRFSYILISAAGYRFGVDSSLFRDTTPEYALSLAHDRVHLIHQMLKYGASFEAVAARYSHDINSRDDSGFVGWARRGVYTQPFDSVAFALGPGEFSAPYRNAQGWHLVKVSRHYEEGPMPIDSPGVFDQARDRVLERDRTLRGVEVRDSLLAIAEITYFDSLFATPADSLEETTPLAIINGIDTVFAGQFKGRETIIRNRPTEDRTPPQIRRDLTRASAEMLALISAARRAGYDTLPTIRRIRDSIWTAQGFKALENSLQLRDDWQPTDSAMRAFYEEHIDDYMPPQPYEVEHLELNDSSLAAFLLAQTETGLELPDLMKEWGPEGQGYDIAYQPPRRFSREEVPDQYWRFAAATPRDGYNVFMADSLYYLIHLTDLTILRRYEMARADVRTRLIEQRRRRHFNRLRDSLFQEHNVRFADPLPEVRLMPLDQRVMLRTQEYYEQLEQDSLPMDSVAATDRQ